MPKKLSTKTSKKQEKSKKITQVEFEKKVIDFAKKGLTCEKIGESLRKEAIHPKEHSKKISKILKESNLPTNPDLQNIQAKFDRITKHYEKNKQDKRAMREKDRVFSQQRKLKKYLKIPLK
jgi:ribosomal protein S15P/S13E